MSALSPLPLDGAGVSVSVKGGRRRGGKLGAGEEVKVELAPVAGRRHRSRRAGQAMPGADMEGARRRRRSRRAGQAMPGADMEGARRRRSRRAGQEGARRRHRSRKH